MIKLRLHGRNPLELHIERSLNGGDGHFEIVQAVAFMWRAGVG
jgi:hypothetical protein